MTRRFGKRNFSSFRMSNRVAGAAPKPSPVVKQCNQSLKQMFGHKDSRGEVTKMYLIQKQISWFYAHLPLSSGAGASSRRRSICQLHLRPRKTNEAWGSVRWANDIFLTPNCLWVWLKPLYLIYQLHCKEYMLLLINRFRAWWKESQIVSH